MHNGAGIAARADAVTARRALWLLCVATVTVFSTMYITQPILPVLGAEFDVSPALAGLTVSALVIAVACASIPYGLLSDRLGRKPVLVGGIIALTLPTLLCAIAPTFPLLLLARVGQGLLVPAFTAVAITYIQEETPAAQRGGAMGMYIAATVVGGFLGRVQSAIITDVFNWRWAFVSFGLTTLLSGGALARWLPPSRGFAPGVSGVARLSQLGRHLQNPRLLLTYATGFGLFFAFIGLFTYLPYYLTRPPFTLSTALVGFVFVVYLAGVVAAPLSGRLSDRVGRPRLIAGGLALVAGGMGATLVPFLPVVIVALVVVCFGMFATQSAVQAQVGDSVRDGTGRGSAVSLYTAFFYLGGSLGGYIPGLVWQGSGWAALVAVIGGTVAAVLVLWLLTLWRALV